MKSPYRFYVYQWRNLKNGKLYIGKGTGGRVDRHRWASGSHRGCLLHRAIKKHGREAFAVTILVDGLTSEEACLREQHYISSRKSCSPGGYNLSTGGESGAVGVLRSPEWRAKLAAAKSGKAMSAETRAALSEATLGKRKSAAHCEAIRAGKTGRKHSAEQSAAISRSLQGHVISDETRAKIGAANKGKTLGRPKSPEHRAKLALALEKARAERIRRLALATT